MIQNERKQKRESMVQGIDLCRCFELATSNEKDVNYLILHEIESENLLDYTFDFELNGSMPIGPFELKTNITF